MKNEITRQSIYKVINGVLMIPPQQFRPEADLRKAYTLDSLGLLEVLLSIDEYFNTVTDVPDEKLENFKTSIDIADFYMEYHNVSE